MIGPEKEIMDKAKSLGRTLSHVTIVDPSKDPKRASYEQMLFEIRKAKGMTLNQAQEIVATDVLYYGALMLKNADADAVVSGASHTSGDVIRAGIQVIGTKKDLKTVSGSFFMEGENQNLGEEGDLIFADCAVLPEPTSEQLADIAVATADTFKALSGKKAKVALLSFSTKGSASHESVSKVQEAVEILKSRNVDFDFDGELQLDAAIVANVGKKKAPGSLIAGKASCLIFPNLAAGNIGYKIAERFGNMKAYGPIIQGLAKPFNDLSRGCSVNDIVITSVISLLKATE
jgi:phosphate acetyltransferase